MADTNITQDHATAFERIRNAVGREVALFSCFVNGEPASAIVLVTKDGDGCYLLEPVFVSVTPGMKLVDHDGVEPTKGGK